MSDPNFHPAGDRVLVRLVEQEEGAIKVPDGARPKPQQGTIVAVGPGVSNQFGVFIKPNYHKGQHVYFGKYAGSDIELEGQNFLIMREEELIGHVPPTSEGIDG